MPSLWKGAGRFAGVGLELFLSVSLGLFAGHWVDSRFQLSPYLTLLGLALGVSAGARAVARALKEANRLAALEEAEMKRKREQYYRRDAGDA